MQKEILVEREFRGLNRQRLYYAWTAGQELQRWWGPEAMIEARPGGECLFHYQGLRQQRRVKGEILAVTPEEAIEFTWKWEEEEAAARPSQARVTFADTSTGAKVSIRHDITHNENACTDGWKSALARLADSLPFTHDYTRFEVSMNIRATLERTFAAWVLPRQIEKWFVRSAAKLDGDLKAIADDTAVLAGQFYEWEWTGCPAEFGKILEVAPNRRLVFDFGGTSNQGRELRTRVTVEFESVGENTRVRVAQDGIADTPRARHVVYEDCKLGWSMSLLQLKAYLEHGVDLRDPAQH